MHLPHFGLAALALLGAGASAAAQTPSLDRLKLEALQQQNMRAEEQSNTLRRADADLQQAVVDNQRRQTEAALRALPAPAPAAGAPSQIQSNEQTLRRLQDAELAAGDARLRAITPAP